MPRANAADPSSKHLDPEQVEVSHTCGAWRQALEHFDALLAGLTATSVFIEGADSSEASVAGAVA